MPWFKVDDTLSLHPKVLRAGNAAMGLWVRAGSWAMQQLTDGHVPGYMASLLGTPDEIAALVEVGLWLEVDDGYQFHDWFGDGSAGSIRQPSRAQVEAERSANAERQRRRRELAAASRRESRRDTTRDSHGSHTVSHGPPDPTRPDPSPAAAAAVTPPLPPAVEILRGALAAAKLEARWDRLTGDELDEIAALVDTHGDSALVKSAIASHRPEKPAAFAQAWLKQWRNLAAAGQLRLVQQAEPCPKHAAQGGTTRFCVSCTSEAIAIDR